MPFRGLFIGIDRYSSTGIDELTCARRDATALEALFFDTLGGSTVLLADAEATRQRIEDAFAPGRLRPRGYGGDRVLRPWVGDT